MHRNSQKRIYGDYVYFITCDVHDKFEFFKDSLFCDLWIEEIKLCQALKQFLLIAFCLNYDHFHWMIKPNNEIADYSEIMQFLKRNFSHNANKILGYIPLNKISKFDNEGDNAHCRYVPKHWVRSGDNAHCRLQNHESWQNEMDEFVLKMREKIISIYGAHHKFPKFKWQKSFHDHVIRNQKDFENHWNYTMYNYKKHELPENWQYTGLNYAEMINAL